MRTKSLCIYVFKLSVKFRSSTFDRRNHRTWGTNISLVHLLSPFSLYWFVLQQAIFPQWAHSLRRSWAVGLASQGLCILWRFLLRLCKCHRTIGRVCKLFSFLWTLCMSSTLLLLRAELLRSERNREREPRSALKERSFRRLIAFKGLFARRRECLSGREVYPVWRNPICFPENRLRSLQAIGTSEWHEEAMTTFIAFWAQTSYFPWIFSKPDSHAIHIDQTSVEVQL